MERVHQRALRYRSEPFRLAMSDLPEDAVHALVAPCLREPGANCSFAGLVEPQKDFFNSLLERRACRQVMRQTTHLCQRVI